MKCIPLKPHLYTEKLGFAGDWVYLFFLFLLQKRTLWVPPRRDSSNMYPQSMFWAKRRKISKFSYWNFSFLQFQKTLCIAWASFLIAFFLRGSVVKHLYIHVLQVDAMKVGVKDFKKAYKHVNIDDIEVCITYFCSLRLSYIFMPPTLKKLEGHIAFGLSVCLYVCYTFFVTSEWCMLGIWNFICEPQRDKMYLRTFWYY